MKLRNMSAYVTEGNITIELANGEVLNLENALVLHSYSSRVAVYCKMRIYLLPFYDYSVCAHSPIESLIGKERNRIRSTFTMSATRNEVYSEFANAVLDEF